MRMGQVESPYVHGIAIQYMYAVKYARATAPTIYCFYNDT